MIKENKICPKCNTNPLKGWAAKQCMECYKKQMSAAKPHNYKGAYLCECGNKKAWHAKKCRNCAYDGLPNCIVCGQLLSIHKNSKQYNTGICQKCYKGELTKRWNHKLTEEDRKPFRTKQPAYYEWRNSIFKRNNYTCQCCNDNTGGNLVSHHIENFAENKDKRFDINNGITLCESCHKSFHKKCGYKNNDRVQLMDFIKQHHANWIVIANN